MLRAAYDADAQRIAGALREVFRPVATSTLVTARARMAELDAAIESGMGTVMIALDLVRAERPPRPRRVAKAALRERRGAERFWTRQLMQLVDLRTRTSWIALDTPGLLLPTPLADAFGSPLGAARPP